MTSELPQPEPTGSGFEPALGADDYQETLLQDVPVGSLVRSALSRPGEPKAASTATAFHDWAVYTDTRKAGASDEAALQYMRELLGQETQ